MLIARTRSSRFFVVVLHLVCVSTHLLPKDKGNGKSSILWREIAATVQIQTVLSAVSMLSMTERSNRNAAAQDTSELEPHWLQDAQDQKCLGPMGHFSECGDANLWRVIPKSKRHARRRQWIRWATEEEDDDHKEVRGYYALQIFDDDISEFYNRAQNKSSERNRQDPSLADSDSDFIERDCITRRRKDNKLVTISCSEDRAWYWRINQYGVLHFQKPARGFGSSSRRSSSGNQKRLLNKRQNLESCVWRNSSLALLSPCDGHQPDSTVQSATSLSPDWNGSERLALLQFVRHQNPREVSSDDSPQLGSTGKLSNVNTQVGTAKRTNNQVQKHSESMTRNTKLPSRVDIAHSHASVPSDRAEPRLSTFHATSIFPHRSSETMSAQIPHFLGNTNPILLATGPKLPASAMPASKENGGKSISSNSKKKSRKKSTRTSENEKNTAPRMIHNNGNLSPSLSEKPIVRKIQTNPYIAASENERWVDPLTGLVYRTDLCQYLGHERKDVGRHTLTGVGQYTKTMLNIKVYGVGFYASKRDILADPSFEPYASLSSEGLRQSTDFFHILRSMKGFTTSSQPTGSFDRTIFLKINMQLSTETMRSSLDADWKMLTPESKQLLIGSSMQPRPADPIFLEIAQSPDNPNRCTCAQIAPEEYGADPSCCARGTELVFTWRKNGNLEVRLNGVFMDSFPRPDIAEGIFFEYLRLDNPMSFDFLDRVVDGFPLLLAPLSQVKGVTTPTTMHHTTSTTHVGHGGNPVTRMIGGFGGAITSQAATLAEFVQSGTQELAGSAIDTARSVGSKAKSIGEEVERRRDLIGKHVSTFTNQALSSLVPSNQKSLSIQLPGWISDTELDNLPDDLFPQDTMTTSDHRTSYTRTISRIIGFEDESLSASNLTQKFFFGLVHLYLLLLLIASFPAQWTTRTKLVVTRKNQPSHHNTTVPTDSENSDSDESGASSVGLLDRESMTAGKENQLKKSLSYVL